MLQYVMWNSITTQIMYGLHKGHIINKVSLVHNIMQQRYWIKKNNQDLSSKAFQYLKWVLIERGSLVILDGGLILRSIPQLKTLFY